MKLFNFIGLLVLALFVLSVPSEAQKRKSVSAAEVNGTFRARGGNEFKILALGNNKLKVAFSGLYAYKTASGEATANTGEAEGEAEINGDTAVFKPEGFEENCTITLRFVKPGRLEVAQEGYQCGFGFNVSADGNYRKISSRKPKFD